MSIKFSDQYKQIFQIYNSEIPDFILPFLGAPVLSRLSDIYQGCGTEYCRLYDYKFPQSRLDHSVGVALIIRHFTGDMKQTLAGLLHDISHTVFSHVGDFLLGDAVKQESSEKHTEYLLANDPVITSELSKLNISLSDVQDYTMYTIADNPGPQLSADRLEYTLSNAIRLGFADDDQIKDIYDNILILNDERGDRELGFGEFEYGDMLGRIAIKNDSQCFSNYRSTVSQSFLAEILRLVQKQANFNSFQLYTMREQEIINIIENSSDDKVRKMREFFTKLDTFKVHQTKPNTRNFLASSLSKKRYIDPLIKTENGVQRLSAISQEFDDMTKQHLSIKEEWIELDFEV